MDATSTKKADDAEFQTMARDALRLAIIRRALHNGGLAALAASDIHPAYVYSQFETAMRSVRDLDGTAHIADVLVEMLRQGMSFTFEDHSNDHASIGFIDLGRITLYWDRIPRATVNRLMYKLDDDNGVSAVTLLTTLMTGAP